MRFKVLTLVLFAALDEVGVPEILRFSEILEFFEILGHFETFRGQISSRIAISDLQSPRQSEIWGPENQRTPF